MKWLKDANRNSPWADVNVAIAGGGLSGAAAGHLLLDHGAKVTVVDSKDLGQQGELLEFMGARLAIGSTGEAQELPSGTDLVIVSPGWRPNHKLLVQAAKAGIPIWSEIELAWRFQQPDRIIPWLGITGTNGKTTTTRMTQSILAAAGYQSAAVGNIGRPVTEALLDEVEYDVLVLELSSFQLHYTHSLSLHSAAVLNVDQDHLEWYEDVASWRGGAGSPMAAYTFDKGQIYQNVQHSCVYNVAQQITEDLVKEADVIEGARAIGFTLDVPRISQLGIVDDLIVDRAFVPQRYDSALELAKVSDVQPAVPHNLENALAAAALARSFGVPAQAVAQGLKNLEPGAHRVQVVGSHNGITFVDDSKATNPHAAASAMRGYESFIWIAGGQAKGTTFDKLIMDFRDRIKGAVLLGTDREVIAQALTRHAPDVPVKIIDSLETSAMDLAVQQAIEMAFPGQTILMSPGCASLDMWPGYAARGDDFSRAVMSWMANN